VNTRALKWASLRRWLKGFRRWRPGREDPVAGPDSINAPGSKQSRRARKTKRVFFEMP
jgi:hypothetical protein